VLADLHGYGNSGKPAPDAADLVYAKRSMARDPGWLMRQLGFGQFGLIGHDRGARVAHRLVLDHPGTVTRLVVLDIVPTQHVLGNVTWRWPPRTPTGSRMAGAAELLGCLGAQALPGQRHHGGLAQRPRIQQGCAGT